jgi:hypothetical protein
VGVAALLALALAAAGCTETPTAVTPGGVTDPGSGPGWLDDHGAGAADSGPGYVDIGPLEGDGVSCVAFETVCSGPTTQAQCTASGDSWIASDCPSGKGCQDGQCVDQTCQPGITLGECTGPTSHDRCNLAGTGIESVTCTAGKKCFKGICIDQLCVPGQRLCKTPTSVQICTADETWVDHEICPSGGLCSDGFCLSPCDVNIKAGSYLGCEYWAMDLDNIEESEAAPVGIVVSVPSDRAATTVTVSDNQGPLTPAELGVASTLVQPGSVQVFRLPTGFDIDGSQKTDKVFHIETTSPVAVHQFNPINGDGVYTNDASLLLPSNVTGRQYVVLSWPHRNDGATLRGFATVIATQKGFTEVAIEPTAPVVGGPGIAAMQPGTPYLFVLAQGEALNFETDGADGVDLTGTVISASQKISVIAGHECANVPQGISACDHLEQQLFPVETWSTQYIADAFKARSPTQVDIYRVVAGANDVTVTTTPPVPGYEQFKLQKGGWLQFASPSSFQITANGAIMVGHYLTGARYPGAVEVAACEVTAVGKPEPLGDPAFTLSAPIKQYLAEYVVLTPSGYMDPTNPLYAGQGVSNQNYLNIIAKQGTAVTIDGAPVSASFVPIPGTEWAVATQAVAPGVHTVVSAQKFGLTAYGYDCDVSYAYPGGLKLVGFSQ